MTGKFDVVIVGAGIIGSCTAYHCQRLGLRTLLLEQFALGHKNGSSHGESRIIRYAHDKKEYIPLVDDAYKQIKQLEEQNGVKLWKKTGYIWMGDKSRVAQISQNLTEANIDHTVLGRKEAREKYPQFEYDENCGVLYDPMGGYLFADKWLETFQKEFKKLGGVIIDNEKLKSYEFKDSKVLLKTENSEYSPKKAIFTVGTWLQELIPECRSLVQPKKLAVAYWKPKDSADLHLFQPDRLPTFTYAGNGEAVYGLPTADRPDAIKFLCHEGYDYSIGSEPEGLNQERIDELSNHLQKHIPKIDASKPVYLESCKYTMTIDKHYILDHHPKNENVIIGGGMSGSGFKVAPGVGRVLAHWAAGRDAPYDVSFFSLKRFANQN